MALADSATAAQATAVADAVQTAGSLPAPANNTQLVQQVAIVQPSVQAVIAQGDAAIVSLNNQTAGREPAVLAALRQDLPLVQGPVHTSSAPLSVATPLSVAAPLSVATPLSSSCESAQFWVSYYLGPLWAFTLSLKEPSWCGNGTNITYELGGLQENTTAVGECLTFSNWTPLQWASYWNWAQVYEVAKSGAGIENARDTWGSPNYTTVLNYHGNMKWNGTSS